MKAVMDKSRKDFQFALDAYAEARHRNGAHVYNATTAAARDAAIALFDAHGQASRKQTMEEKEGEHRPTGFMCAIAFDHEVGFKASGNKIFPDAEDLEKHRSCGIYEVELRCIRVVVEPDLSEDNLVSLRSLEGNAKETT